MTCTFLAMSGGLRVLVDQAARDRFSADPLGAEVSCSDAGSVVFAVGDALGDALVRPRAVLQCNWYSVRTAR
jgi:hypothetical protein